MSLPLRASSLFIYQTLSAIGNALFPEVPLCCE